MNFRPVWLSSLAHLHVFDQTIRSASLPRTLLGRHRIPPSFPHLVFYLRPLPFVGKEILYSRLPIVYFAQGTLSLDANSIRFAAEPPADLARGRARGRHIGVDSQLEFRLSPTTLISVERYQGPQLPTCYIGARYYTPNWVRLRTTEPILDGDFLLCVGSSGPLMGKSRTATDQLHAALESAHANSHAHPQD